MKTEIDKKSSKENFGKFYYNFQAVEMAFQILYKLFTSKLYMRISSFKVKL